MNTKKIVAVLIIAIVGLSTMNAQEMNHSKMKKDSTTMMNHSKMKMKAMYTCPMHADVKSEKAGECPKCGMELKKMEMKPMYTCSMHPEVVSDKKGECPKCGMALTEKKKEMKKEGKHQSHKHK
jgi:uncharacterized paraquat-inducible protein A